MIQEKDGKSPFFEERRHTVAKLLDMTKNVKGNVVECGVMEGYTTIIMGKKLKDMCPEKTLYGIDYFDTLPYDDNDFPFKRSGVIKKKFIYNKFKYQPAIDIVQERIDTEHLDNIKLIKGLVEYVLPTMKDQKFSFVNVDVNSYKATKFCLEFFKDKMNKGGIIFLDDYNQVAWQGATLAANEVLGKNKIVQLKHVQAYWVRN